MSPRPVRKKHGNIETTVDGIKFASKLEAWRYGELLLMERAGAIRDVRIQVPFELQPAFRDSAGKAIRAIHYIADFVYYEGEACVVEETKGHQTDVSRIKMKMLKRNYPYLDVRMIYDKPKAKPKRKAKAGFGKGVVK